MWLCVWGIQPFRMKAGFPCCRLPPNLWMPWAYCGGVFFVLVSLLCEEKFDLTEPQSILTPGSWWVSLPTITQQSEGCGSSRWDWSPLPEHWVAVWAVLELSPAGWGSLILSAQVLCPKCSDARPFPAPQRTSTTFISPLSKRGKAPVTCVLLKPGQLLGAFLWQELSILNIYV